MADISTQDPDEIQIVQSTEEHYYQEFGGWLILAAFGVVASPIIYLVNASIGLSSDHHPTVAPLVIFEIVANIGLFILSIAVAVAFFQKRKFLPKLIIATLLSGLAVAVIDYLLAHLIPILASMDYTDWTRRIIFSGCMTGVWINYFLKSERVKATFVK